MSTRQPRLCQVVFAALILLCATSGFAEGRPMTFEDMIKLKEIKSLAMSPDAKSVAFTLTGRNLDTNNSYSSVWVLELANRKLVHVTADGNNESSPAWSPDGQQIAFVSDKTKKAQIYRAGLHGEPPVQVTDLTTGASSPRWLPGGKHIVFTSRVFPDCQIDLCNGERLADVENDPVKARVIDKLMYRNWDHWRDGRFAHLFIVSTEGGDALDLMPGNNWGVTGDFDIDPKGKWVVFATKDPEKEEQHTNQDLYLVQIVMPGQNEKTPGSPAQLTRNPAYDDGPVISPTGEWLAYRSQARPGYESDRFRLTLLPLGGGKPVYPAQGMDRWVVEYGWYPFSNELWFAVLDRGAVAVYKVDAQGKNGPQQLFGGAYNTDIQLLPDGKSFVCVSQKFTKPAEIFTINTDPKERKQMTTFNEAAMRGVQLAEVEEVWWKGAGGALVHGYVLFPKGTFRGKKNPLLVLIHGGPQGMWSDRHHPRWNPQLFAAPGYVTFLPNPRGSVGYGQRFTDEINKDWGGKPYEDIMKGVDHLIEEGWVDPDRMCAGGGSYGGYMANWILGNTDRFKCLFSHAGVYDLRSKYGSTEELWFPEWEFGGPPWESEEYEKWSPSRLAKNFHTPMLVTHGAHDYRVAENQAFQLFTALQRLGVPSRFVYFPDETHFVWKPLNSQLWYKEVHGWLKKYIGQ